MEWTIMLGKHLKGYILAQNGATLKLYVDASLAPFLELETAPQTYCWNSGVTGLRKYFKQQHV
ncbi:MAG: hypothetical protein OEV24_02800 [Cyclobacteriaceae bacterium]|jgi:hypothetical protein|nr:hypothetical protein [Cyclobacteriaceae bacterium]MDH5249457.1 hypothetical protein [Cyclobacteriaceae bacterium]